MVKFEQCIFNLQKVEVNNIEREKRGKKKGKENHLEMAKTAERKK